MTTQAEVARRLELSTAMPYGAARTREVTQIVELADALADDRLTFVARVHLTSAHQMGGTKVDAFTSFSWCLAHLDQHPADHDEYDLHQVLWHYKWMVATMIAFPQLSLERAMTSLDDLERRYREASLTLHPAYGLRRLIADHVGDEPAAEAAYERWVTAPRGSNSDCEGCDPAEQALYLAARGRDVEAVERCRHVLDGTLHCEEQPAFALTAILIPYVRLGRLADARDAHRRAYRQSRLHRRSLGELAQHLEFCVATQNLDRGLDIVGRHVGWLDEPPTPHAGMLFSAAASAVLVQAAAASIEGSVYRPGAGSRPADRVPIPVLAETLASEARALARQFDDRNGTDHQSRLIERMITAAPITDWVPLTTTQEAVAAARPVTDAAPRPVVPTTAGLDDLLERAEAANLEQRPWRAVQAWRAAGDRATDDPVLAARQRIGGVAALLSLDDPVSDVDDLPDAWRTIESAATIDQRHANAACVAGRAVAAALAAGGDLQGASVILDQLARLPLDPVVRAATHRMRARVAEAAGDPARAADATAHAEVDVGEAGSAYESALHAWATARHRLAAAADSVSSGGQRAPMDDGSPEPGTGADERGEIVNEVLALVGQLQHAAAAEGRANRASSVLREASQMLAPIAAEQAVALARAALDTADDDLILVGDAQAALARAFAIAGELPEALDAGLTAVVLADRAGRGLPGVETRWFVGRVLLGLGRSDEAAEVTEEARGRATTLNGDQRAALDRSLAEMHEARGDLEGALGSLDDAAAWTEERLALRLRGAHDLENRRRALDDAWDERSWLEPKRALALDALGRSADAVDAWAAAVLAHEQLGATAYALRCRARYARAMSVVQPDRGLAALETVRDDLIAVRGLDDFDGASEVARVDDDRARVLLQLGRLDDAASVARDASDALAASDEPAEAAWARLVALEAEYRLARAEDPARNSAVLALIDETQTLAERSGAGAAAVLLHRLADAAEGLPEPARARELRAAADRWQVAAREE